MGAVVVLRAAIALKPIAGSGVGVEQVPAGSADHAQLSVLDHHPNHRWRPVESNSNFLGFYRLKILD